MNTTSIVILMFSIQVAHHAREIASITATGIIQVVEPRLASAMTNFIYIALSATQMRSFFAGSFLVDLMASGK